MNARGPDRPTRQKPVHSARGLHRGRSAATRPKDPYETSAKDEGALVCEDCGLVRHAGRWSSGAAPLGPLRAGRCPACRRVRERYPAGTLRLDAGFLPSREELLQLVRKVERAETLEHPLERVMDIEVGSDGLVVTTTGIHLARRIAGRIGRTRHIRPRTRYAEDSTRVEFDFRS